MFTIVKNWIAVLRSFIIWYHTLRKEREINEKLKVTI